MFHIYEGFHLVETYHKMRHQRKYHPEDSTKRVIKIALVALVTLLLWNIPTEWYGIQNLTVIQQRIIAIFAFATLMWILEIVSSWATSVAIIVIMLLFCTDSGIMPMVQEEEVGKLLSYKGVMATFADPVIMLFIGGFVLAIAATKTGLDAQLAKVLLKPFGTKSEMVLLGFLLVTGLFSMFVSNTATAAMMLTFLTPVFRQLPPEGKGRIALAMSIPVAANLGGMGTPIGTPPNTIALKYLNDPEGLNMGLSFGQWMMFMFPLVVVLLFISWRLLLKFFPFTQKTVELKIDGGMQKGFQSKVVIVTFIVTIALWLSDQFTGINANTVAMIPFAVFALTGIINKRDLEQINWSVIWMVAGGFALGYGLNASGLAANAVASIPFGEFEPEGTFDGIWACASLLHLPKGEIVAVMRRMAAHLAEGGCFYASFKYGEFQGERNGRYFTDMTEESFRELLEGVPGLAIEEYFSSGDVRAGRESERWLNVMMRKVQQK